MSARAAAVQALAERLGHTFADPSLLEQALTHSSVGQGARHVAHNERLEFLGDRVLGLLVAEALYRRFADEREGELHTRLNALVDAKACAAMAREWGVGPALRLPAGETRRGARDGSGILADACEAVLAAIYLDGGMDAARRVVVAWWGPKLENAPAAERLTNPKTQLQHWALARGPHLPRYELVGREGPEHEPRFRVRVEVEGASSAESEGASRRAAEAAAAAAFLQRELGA